MHKLFVFILILLSYVSNTCYCSNYHALVFGIGRYEDSNWSVINADNDVKYVISFLKKSGFKDIKTIKNNSATKKKIENSFIELINKCQCGDIVYIQYSGHGQLITDTDGDEFKRSSSRHNKFDESWIPYDAYVSYCKNDDGEKHLTDDEVAYFLTKIREKIGDNGKLYVVIDACHSGEATRGSSEVVRGSSTPFIIPGKFTTYNPTLYKENWLTISACQPYQVAMEMKYKKVGKLTYAIYSLGPKLFKIDNNEIEKYLMNFFEKNKGRLPQTPMVTGHK